MWANRLGRRAKYERVTLAVHRRISNQAHMRLFPEAPESVLQAAVGTAVIFALGLFVVLEGYCAKTIWVDGQHEMIGPALTMLVATVLFALPGALLAGAGFALVLRARCRKKVRPSPWLGLGSGLLCGILLAGLVHMGVQSFGWLALAAALGGLASGCAAVLRVRPSPTAR